MRRRWIIGLTLASLGMWMATQTPLQVMLALQLQDITPRHKIVALGVVTGVGAIQNGEYATLSAAIPDHVPVRQRATVAGWVGMPIALGLVLGTILVVDVLGQACSS